MAKIIDSNLGLPKRTKLLTSKKICYKRESGEGMTGKLSVPWAETD